MGIDAGILALRHAGGDPLPWPSSYYRFFPTFKSGAPLSSSNAEEGGVWLKVADYQSIQLLVITATVVVMDEVVQRYPFVPRLPTSIWLTGTKRRREPTSLACQMSILRYSP